VCRECNGGLGTIDIALKNADGVMLACYDRDVGGARSGRSGNRSAKNSPKNDDEAIDIIKLSAPRPKPFEENPDIKGAILKIAYEATHLRLGNDWLRDPITVTIKNILFAYVNKNKTIAREHINSINIRDINIDAFYYVINKSRSELIKRAISSKSCLNALWIIPFKTETKTDGDRLAIVYDIEGIAPGYVEVGKSTWGIDEAELLAPQL
jgi:hypothetical protein